MEQAALFAVVLADQCIGDVQHHAVAERRQGVDFRDRGGEAARVRLEAHHVVRAAEGEAEEISADTGGVVIQKRGDVDDFGHALGDQFRDVGLATDAFALAAKFQISPHELSEDGSVGRVESVFIKSDVHAALGPGAVAIRDIHETRQAQITLLPIPDDDVRRGHACFEQPFDDRGDHAGARAAGGAG